MTIKWGGVPPELRERDQWVRWKTVVRDGQPTKVLFSLDDSPAKSNEPKTWAPFERVREAEWRNQLDRLNDELMVYKGTHSDAFILEGCGTAEAAAEAIERHVEEHGARYAVVDYVQ